MEDAAGMTIRQVDTVAFNSTPGDRGRVVQAVPSTPRSSNMMLQVQRVDGTRVEAKSGDLTIVDRSCLRPGMVVVSASDPGSQLGVVMAAATALDLVRLVEDGGQEAVARGVPATELRRVTGLCLCDYVVSAGGRWLGRVVETYVDVDVLFDDGGRCRVTEADRKLRTVETGYLNGYANTPFYQGRRVVGRRSPVFKASRWLNGSYWKPSYVEGTVAMVKMTGVLVCWLASPDTTGVSAPPAYQQNLDDLIFFSAANIIGTWSVGDRCFFRRNPDDHESSSRGPPTRKGRQMRRRRRRSNRTRQMRFEFERPMSVADTHTTVDVLWQDGTRQRRMPSVALLPFVAKNEHDFFPGQHVRRAVDDDGPQEGVVRSLDCVEQTVRVSWLNNSSDETLSAYHLRRILDHDVFYGNVVVRLDGDAAGDLSWVGRIVHLCDDGQVQVKWGDGNTTEVYASSKLFPASIVFLYTV
jgi:ubiquitin-conjugating enzyme E2 O